MYYVGEGEDRKPVFEVGDAVRIVDQEHNYCGWYGYVRRIGGEGFGDDQLWLARTEHEGEDEMIVSAFQSQVEAN